MTESSDTDSGATAEDETPRGAPAPNELDDREAGDDDDGGEEGERGTPSAIRDDEERYHDRHDEAREVENPDQHRDEEAYD